MKMSQTSKPQIQIINIILLLIRFNNKFLMQTQIDYRNAKYQGEINKNGSRNGLGILIDDDLSFYASHWNSGKLNGSSLIYISHGKYIYGQWQNNQPNGLNVFRIGDTVILGQFVNGKLIGRILVIFERVSFIAILELIDEDNWEVVERGTLRNYDDLINYIEKARIQMQSHLFSLTKFLVAVSNKKMFASPCKTSENCYFGFESGLGIIFNPNNGVVSVGFHECKRIYEYGGRYEGATCVEGNFETNQLITFSKNRPTNEIYSIFQKLHKRSLNFKNQYFDSKVKLLKNVEDLVRDKISEIIKEKPQKQQKNVTAIDLNDSLDYHAESIQELNKINKMRQEVYESAKDIKITTKNMKGRVSPCMTPKKSNKIYAPASPVFMKKSPSKKQDSSQVSKSSKHLVPSDRSRKRSSSKTPINVSKKLKNQDNYHEQSPVKFVSKEYVHEKESFNVPTFNYQEKKDENFDTVVVKQNIEQNFPCQVQYPVKKESKFREKEEIRKNLYKEKENEDNFKLKGPCYEDLSQRRNRILRQFKQLNVDKSPSKLEPKVQKVQKREQIRSYKNNFKKQIEISEYESPCIREKLNIQYSRNHENENEMLPLSMKKYINNEVFLNEKSRNTRQLSPYSYQRIKKAEQVQRFDISEKERESQRLKQQERQRINQTPTKRKTYKYYFD